MNSKKRTLWICAIIIILLTGCGGNTSTQATIPSVTGTLTLWNKGTPVENRRLTLCRIVDESTLPMADCVLEKTDNTSNADGAFQIYDVKPGKYYVLYESGMGDFTSAMKYWGGRTFSWLDDAWNKEYWDEFVGYKTGMFVEFQIPQGMPMDLMTNSEFVQTYQLIFLLFPPSPFFVAFDVEKSFDRLGYLEAHTIIEVVEGQTTNVQIQVIK